GALVARGHARNGSIGWGMREAGKLLGVRYGHYNDIAGKVMGLQAYGTVDTGYLAWLDRFSASSNSRICGRWSTGTPGAATAWSVATACWTGSRRCT
ncbi:hypothetical protein, partial [Ramlibacter sp.]|uniref:hypothetical protein n=1 Tax=Ramlibacter sp. TaxID=1917967 RepID=UPI00260F0FEE